jgi:Ca-activated chloride channel family protein
MRTVLSLLVLCSLSLANGRLDVAGPVRLTSHQVGAKIHDRVAQVTVEQTFFSDARAQLEGTYVFPLPDGATVSAFAMTMGGKMVEGQVMERGKAKRIYEGIVSRKKDPGLLEKVDDGVFRARVFPIEPQSALTIRIVYQQLLPEHAGTMELRYPLARERMKAADVQTVAFDVEIESTADLRAVYSPSHEVEVVRKDARSAHVGWEGGRSAQDKDFLLYIGRSADAVAFSLLSHKQPAEPGTFVALLSPLAAPKEEEILPKDVIYVLDTSGSMQGAKIAQAQAALKFGIGSLRPGDRFNVVAFSTEAQPFRDGLVDANAETQAAAQAWVGKLNANGGTALDEALQTALRMPQGERLGIVVLLTDGLPSVGIQNPELIVTRAVNANKANARVFVFGVGFDQNVAFLDRITTLTRGAREYITPKQDLEIVVSRFFKRIDQPVLSDLQLELGEGVSEVYPKRLPDLFAGDQLVVMGRYETPGERRIELHGQLRGKPITYVYVGSLAEQADVAPLPRLWAERKVAYLLEQIDVHGRQKELVDEVVRLGVKHTIVTRYTSGLVVEDEELEDVPIEVVELDDSNEAGTSDTAFEGPSTNSSIGLSGGAGGGRRGRGGKRNLRAGGGTGLTENATEFGLKWLAEQQDDATGAWNDVESSAWALLAYLGAGYTDRGSTTENKYARTVRMGLRSLMVTQKDDGSFGGSARADMVATLALSEAYWMTRNPRYRKPAQNGLDHLAKTRVRPDWGWGDDTIYAVLALKSGKNAGLEVDPDAFEGARHWFVRLRPKTDAERAGALLGRILMGEDPRTSEDLKQLAEEIGAPEDDLDLLQLGSLALFQYGRRPWRRWNEGMKKLIVDTQLKDGSWAPLGKHGKVTTTAQLSLCLEVYYRYDRVFGVR